MALAAVGTVRHPESISPVELQRLNKQTMFCTTLRRVKHVAFDEEAVLTDIFRFSYPSTMNPPQKQVVPVEEFPEPEYIRISNIFARQKAQELFCEAYGSADEPDELNKEILSSPKSGAVLGSASSGLRIGTDCSGMDIWRSRS